MIAHSVSVMVIQAGGARLVMDADPERAEASLRSVERAGRDALAEMRRLLGRARRDATRARWRRSRGSRTSTALLAARASLGPRADLQVDGEPATVSPALDLCAYRIVQEALTNAIKHAAPARAEVRVRWARGALELEISDDGRGPGAVNGAGGGHGIAGMRERVALHGGSIEAGAGDGGGFTVRARLPLAGSRRDERAASRRCRPDRSRRRRDLRARRDHRARAAVLARAWDLRCAPACHGGRVGAVRRADRRPPTAARASRSCSAPRRGDRDAARQRAAEGAQRRRRVPVLVLAYSAGAVGSTRAAASPP